MTGREPESKKIIAIVQARMSASRLPGKVLQDINGEPMLVRVVERTHRSQWVDQVVVATSSDHSDDPIEDLCTKREYSCYRGNLNDVLDRYYQAAKHHSAGVVVRITADCPIIDPIVIDQTLMAFYGRGPSLITQSGQTLVNRNLLRDGIVPAWDFTANRLPPPWKRTFPIGLDTEVCTFSALENAWRDAIQPHQREHVLPYLYENDQDFRIQILDHEPDYGDIRWTVDTPQDLELLRMIYERFGGRDDFSWYEVLDLFKREPKLADINAEIKHNDYRDFETTS
ncbi:MAG: glycosyltransferase family protein [Anaerolineales bacterium]